MWYGWARDWDRLMGEPQISSPRALSPIAGIEPGTIPALAEIGLAPDLCPQRQGGGREAALDTLDSFLAERGANYRREMSSPVTAFTACSRLSPHLTWGTVSMREVTQAAYARMADLRTQSSREALTAKGSMNSFAGRLRWHCHFMQKLECEPRLEFKCLHRAYEGLRPDLPDQMRLKAWQRGETGFPFVDACMRALIATGWLNFRMRAMLMSFASYQLWLPWRASGEHLARVFTDYEPGIHWPQVQMQPGTTGMNTLRIYNPVKQSQDQDPAGIFIRRWVPELADVPAVYLHEPWQWEGPPSLLERTYPERIIDHVAAAKTARDQLWAVRKKPASKTEASAVAEKHGSRKDRGNASTGRRKSKPKRSSSQLSFDVWAHALTIPYPHML